MENLAVFVQAQNLFFFFFFFFLAKLQTNIVLVPPVLKKNSLSLSSTNTMTESENKSISAGMLLLSRLYLLSLALC